MYNGLIYSITGGGSKKDNGEKKKEDVLNIFSVASGHLYERFLRWDTLCSQTHTRSDSYFPGRSANPKTHLSPFVCLFQNNDAVCPSAYQNTCQVLVPQELPLPIFQGTSHTSWPDDTFLLVKNNKITDLLSYNKNILLLLANCFVLHCTVPSNEKSYPPYQFIV